MDEFQRGLGKLAYRPDSRDGCDVDMAVNEPPDKFHFSSSHHNASLYMKNLRAEKLATQVYVS